MAAFGGDRHRDGVPPSAIRSLKTRRVDQIRRRSNCLTALTSRSDPDRRGPSRSDSDREVRSVTNSPSVLCVEIRTLTNTTQDKPTPTGSRYRTFQVSKGNGRFRLIYAPSRWFKSKLRRYLPALNLLAIQLDTRAVMHGFMPYRGPVSNASAHVGFKFSLSMDLEDFFDSVHLGLLTSTPDPSVKIPPSILQDALVDDRPPQGFPTSPALANIGGAWLDRRILSVLDGLNAGAVYTRYADDLTISCDDYEVIRFMEGLVPELCEVSGLRVNARKTRIQPARRGRRVITGISVGEHDIRATRESRRRLRAARHNGQTASASGLAGWCELRTPTRSAVVERVQKQLQTAMDRLIDSPTKDTFNYVQYLTLLTESIISQRPNG